ncbi:MAG: 4Fe-4S binding protein, partial [Hyphomicrobiaceae bacterium]
MNDSAPIKTAPAKPESALKKQHLIDPEICIRCYTCESMCTPGAISHDDLNVVVDFAKCNYCMDCISPCPTGSIDVWRIVDAPYSLAEQLTWTEVPTQVDFGEAASAITESLDADVGALLEKAHSGTGGKPIAPASASKPSVNLFSRAKPAIATVQGNFRITAASAENDVRHIVLSFGDTVFP